MFKVIWTIQRNTNWGFSWWPFWVQNLIMGGGVVSVIVLLVGTGVYLDYNTELSHENHVFIMEQLRNDNCKFLREEIKLALIDNKILRNEVNIDRCNKEIKQRYRLELDNMTK